MVRSALIYFSLIILSNQCIAQDNRLVQVSGIIYTLDNNKIKLLPYAEIAIHNTFRVIYGNENAFYSIAAQRGDTILFNYLSYDEETFIVPNNYSEESITLNVQLTQDTVYLPKVTIHPWPSREHFRPEFLAMDIEQTMYNIAMTNLAKDRLDELMLLTPRDGAEHASLYLGQEARKYYYSGQFKPYNITNPLAWLEFFKAWKRGDFKNKKKK
ncbi:MAG: carboxypeptidase-like regulatory domain-containing protein [Saprospiraceae bacterium]|nr:carboxypeptidase-like regulatory domain-containing protein [Saprospiraceae bacterium]